MQPNHMILLPLNSQETKMCHFTTKHGKNETTPKICVHLTKDYIEYTDNYIAFQYKPIANEYTNTILNENLEDTILCHETFDNILKANKDVKTWSGFTTTSDDYRTIIYPPIHKAIDGIENDNPVNSVIVDPCKVEQILNIAKQLYNKKDLSTATIKFNNINNVMEFHFPKTPNANKLTVYLAVCRSATYSIN